MTDPITQAEIDEAQALLAKATPGPWKNDGFNPFESAYCAVGRTRRFNEHTETCSSLSKSNIAIIVLAVNLLPRLLAERREWEAQCARLRNGLEEIASSHIPDQPAAAGGDDLVWAQQHVGRLRRIALNAMESNK